jgi:hypothetical protein
LKAVGARTERAWVGGAADGRQGRIPEPAVRHGCARCQVSNKTGVSVHRGHKVDRWGSSPSRCARSLWRGCSAGGEGMAGRRRSRAAASGAPLRAARAWWHGCGARVTAGNGRASSPRSVASVGQRLLAGRVRCTPAAAAQDAGAKKGHRGPSGGGSQGAGGAPASAPCARPRPHGQLPGAGADVGGD